MLTRTTHSTRRRTHSGLSRLLPPRVRQNAPFLLDLVFVFGAIGLILASQPLFGAGM